MHDCIHESRHVNMVLYNNLGRCWRLKDRRFYFSYHLRLPFLLSSISFTLRRVSYNMAANGEVNGIESPPKKKLCMFWDIDNCCRFRFSWF